MGLEILSDLWEIIPYPIPDFPLYAGIGHLGIQNQYAVGCHFHPDFEFNMVLEGAMDYFINGENIHLNEGDGIFVNSHRLHYNYSQQQIPAKYLVITLSPRLFPRTLPCVEKLLLEVCDIHCTDYLIFKGNESQDIFTYGFKLLHALNGHDRNWLMLLSDAQLLCSKVFPRIKSNVHSVSHDIDWLCLHDMMEHIHEHYKDHLTLSEIAASGRVCRSKCCTIFHRYIGRSPVDYLIFYRVKRSQELLSQTDCPIGEVAYQCGFNGQSYYTEQFKKYNGITPREYRRSALRGQK